MSTKYLSASVVDMKSAGHGGWLAVASTPVVDSDGESLAKGCFNPLPRTVPVHCDHSWRVEDLVGKARPYYDGDLLMLDGTFSGNEKAQRIRGLIQENVLDAMSVFFIDPVRKNINGVQTVIKGKLMSVDFVTMGANPDARLVSVRGYGSMTVAEARRASMRAMMQLAELDIAEAHRALNRIERTKAMAEPPDLADLDDVLADAKAFLANLSKREQR